MPSILPPQKKSKNMPLKRRRNTYISCGRRSLAMIRLLSKTFSNRNQIVTCFLKLFDRIWKDFVSKKHFFFVSNNNQKRKNGKKMNYTLVSENDMKKIFSQKIHLIRGGEKRKKKHTVNLMF